jgi:predicted DNA-binding antitoxin AbrB/MazE fold protein|tara:strand:- start:17 stop:199 length:183 start_codon:yes stop_codon:yes gene_type:complete
MKILTAKYESGTFKPNSVIKVTYEGQPSGSIRNVPINENNRHYQEILIWVKDGNTIEEAD